ncbi:MAG: single-stranded DNA-binding protein [Verrucomicrobiales bacterium]|nr:single-stranded DNA-binding protein [Verrucomicrobiales bacterium]
MDHLETAREVLDSMLGYLGFAATVEVDRDGSVLNIATTSDAKLLIGHHGERMEEIEYLANRVVQDRIPDAPRFKIDIDSYRAARDYEMIEEAEATAARVIESGEALKLSPMNSYQRRLVHNHYKDHPEVETWSPQDSARLKRITIRPRKTK